MNITEELVNSVLRRLDGLEAEKSNHANKLHSFEERYSSIERNLLQDDIHRQVEIKSLEERIEILEKSNSEKQNTIDNQVKKEASSDAKRLRNMAIIAALSAILGGIGASLLAPLIGAVASCL